MSLLTGNVLIGSGSPVFDYVKSHCTILNLHEVVPESPGSCSLPNSPVGAPPAPICEICGQSFSSNSNLNRHRKRGNCNGTVCHLCNRIFSKPASLQKHIESMRCVRPSLNCQYCDKIFTQQKNLKEHLENRVCQRSGKERLEDRLLLRHGEVRDLSSSKCELCDREFAHEKNLAVHIKMVHSGEDVRHICKTCGKQFSTKGALTRHRKKIHDGGSGDGLAYRCSDCNKTFSTRGNLNKHVNQRRCMKLSFSHACHHCGYQKSLHEKRKAPTADSSNTEAPQILSCDKCGKITILHH